MQQYEGEMDRGKAGRKGRGRGRRMRERKRGFSTMATLTAQSLLDIFPKEKGASINLLVLTC